MNNVVITQLKNQSGRLRDWILYHYEEGFETFIIYDDYSEDDTVKEIEEIKNKYNINIIIKYTDGIGGKYGIEDCKNSESYGMDISFHKRLCRSYTQGNNYVKSINPNAICAIIDVDEFLVTSENKKAIDVIKEEMGRLNSKQLVINSFDIDDGFTIGDWYTTQDICSNRWSYEKTMKTHFNARYKSVIVSEDLEEVVQAHILKWADNPIIENFRVYDFEKLRIHHFRKPTLPIKIEFDKDFTMINKMKIIRDKYE